MIAVPLNPADPRIAELLSATHTEINQYPIWGEVQSVLGGDVRLFGMIDPLTHALQAYSQVFVRKLPLGRSWWLIPRGPITPDATSANTLLTAISQQAAAEKTVYIHIAPTRDFDVRNAHIGYRIVDSWRTNFPDTTLVLDLTKSDEDLLKEMHPKGRYNIRLTEKQGVTVRENTSEAGVEIFYELLRKTTARDGFAGHSKKYYQHLVRTLAQPTCNQISIFIAEKDAIPLAAIIVTYAGTLATYYYGASDHAHRALMAPYACQWAAIRAARARGCTSYDFLGIAPEGTTGHVLAGVTEFKRKFGGQVVTYPPSADLVLRPLAYHALKLMRKMRK